jgi:hypothetical protein
VRQLEGPKKAVLTASTAALFPPPRAGRCGSSSDYAACHTHEIDECANVKFEDRIELTAARSHNNRPHDGVEHEALHAKEAGRSGS